MMVRIVLVFTMLVSLSYNTFSETQYKIMNDQIVFTLGNYTIPYELGTKTAEYIMGYLVNSDRYTYLTTKDVTYGTDPSKTIVLFTNNRDINHSGYHLGFLKAQNGTDVIILYDGNKVEIKRFEIKAGEDPANILKVDYVVGQIIKSMNSYYYDGTHASRESCIRNITVTAGIPTEIEFIIGAECP